MPYRLPSLQLACSSLMFLLIIFCVPLHAEEIPPSAPSPEHAISISFDLERHSLNATSRITLPRRTPLHLAGGHLVFSNALLERTGQTPMILKPTADNSITVAAAETAQTVFISWSLTVPKEGSGDNLIGSSGITLAGFWHPLPDIAMTYRLQAQLPPSFSAVSEAVSVTTSLDSSGRLSFSTLFPHPVHGIHFIAGPYRVTERTLANGTLLATYFFPEDNALAEEYLDKAADYLLRYERLIGPYPYPRYNIVENRLPTGYGMPTFTLLGQAVIRLPFIKETSLGHEILHSWFGNSVLLSDAGGNWSEGLTTYLSDHLYAEDRGEGGQYRKEQLQRYGAYVPADNALTLRDFMNASDSQPMARRIRALGYDKGSMVFHMLRRHLGDERFFQGLRLFFSTMRFRTAGWNDIKESFNAAAEEDLSRFFDQWLTRADALLFTVNGIDVSQLEGRSVITFTLDQKNLEPYEFDLPVTVVNRTGESRHTVKISDRTAEVKITVDDVPEAMILDQDYDLMRMLRLEEDAPSWSRFMGAGSKTVVLPAGEELETYAPLLDMLRELGAETVAADALKTDALEQGSFVFLGNSQQSLGLFADPGHSATAFTMDVRANPLNPREAMVLITSPSAAQSGAVVRKLSHYGKYSFLSFVDGRLQEKRIAPTQKGIRISLFPSPVGIRMPDIRSFDEIIDELKKSRVVYVGEVHTDMGAHIMQLQVIQALFRDNPDLAIGMEMFPRAAQSTLDAYINGSILSEQEFLKQSNYFTSWGFDYRLYREIIGFARFHRIPLIGLNIDKAVVDRVFKEGGFDDLDAEQREQVPSERSLDLPGYRARLIQAFAGHDRQGFDPKMLSGFIQSQALWDEAMAETIADYLRDHPGRRMVIIAGNGHVYKDTAIPPRVARRIDVEQSVVSSVTYGSTGMEPGYRMDYLLYTSAIELPPSPKLGVMLEVESGKDDPGKGRVRVKQISHQSKAGDSGMKERDIILTVEAATVHDITDIRIALLDKKPGDKVKVKVLREHDLLPDEELELTVELTAPPELGGMGLMPPSHPK